MKGVSYKEIREMDFTSAKTMKKKLDCKLDSAGDTPSSRSSQKQKTNIPDPTDDELPSFFKALNETGSKPAIIALVLAYSEAYVHQPMQENFPDVLTELKDDDAVELNYSELLKKCQTMEIKVSTEQAKAVELATHEQSNSKLWYRFRAGRITASKMKTACCTDPTLPSQTLIKTVCYPESYKFSSSATVWGCQHEKYARDIFVDKLKDKHENVKLDEVGFFINPNVPFIGASPNGMVTCDCCGD